jgi:hypothetical protein
MANGRSLWRRRVVVSAVIASLFVSGCTRTVTHRVARHDVGGDLPTTQRVTETAMWQVKVRGHGEKDYHGIDGTERWLQPGDVVGFRAGADGAIYAVANDDEIALALDARAHRRVVWLAQTHEATPFGETAAAAGELAAGAAVIALVGGLLLLALDRDDCDRDGYCRKHHKRH